MPKPLIKGGFTPDWGTVTGGSIVGEFRKVDNSAELLVKSVDISIGGTFTATVRIERYIGDTWQLIESTTAPIQRFLESKKPYRTRIVCSSYTSGVVQYVMRA